MSVLALSSAFRLQKTLSPIVAAEASTDLGATSENLSVQPEPEVLQLATGTPQSTIPSDVMPTNAYLRWTPTGTGEMQDTYEVRLSSENNPENGVLPGPQANPVGLTAAEYDIRTVSTGLYYWQVRSCDALTACSDWSQVWSMNIDGTAPFEPTAAVTSDPYDTTVRLAGTSEPFNRITVTVDESSCVVQANETGDWLCVFGSDFDFGDYQALVKATDKAGNDSIQMPLDFSVNELFAAEAISVSEIPVTLDVVPVNESPLSMVSMSPVTSAIDVVDNGDDQAGDVAGAIAPLSVDGGIIQSSQSGWQVFGLPWFVWLGSVAGLTGSFWMFGVPGSRRIGSLLPL